MEMHVLYIHFSILRVVQSSINKQENVRQKLVFRKLRAGDPIRKANGLVEMTAAQDLFTQLEMDIILEMHNSTHNLISIYQTEI